LRLHLQHFITISGESDPCSTPLFIWAAKA
jgi:hypothetical protein